MNCELWNMNPCLWLNSLVRLLTILVNAIVASMASVSNYGVQKIKQVLKLNKFLLYAVSFQLCMGYTCFYALEIIGHGISFHRP